MEKKGGEGLSVIENSGFGKDSHAVSRREDMCTDSMCEKHVWVVIIDSSILAPKGSRQSKADVAIWAPSPVQLEHAVFDIPPPRYPSNAR